MPKKKTKGSGKKHEDAGRKSNTHVAHQGSDVGLKLDKGKAKKAFRR